jgi:hypothetical protein
MKGEILIPEFLATPWAIEPAMLDTIRAIAQREGEGVEALEAKLGRCGAQIERVRG